MLTIIFALISFVGWAISDLYTTILARKMGAYSGTFWSIVISLVILTPYAFFQLADLRKITLEIFILNIVLGIIFTISGLTFLKALKIGNASLVSTIGSSFCALVVLLSMIFLGDRVSETQGISIIIIFLGLILSSFDLKELKKGKILNKGIILAIITMLIWGIYYTFIKIPISQIGWFWPNYIFLISSPLVLLIFGSRKLKIERPNINGAFIPLFLASIIALAAELSFNFAISKNLTAIVAPIAGSYPALFVVLAFFFFKDPITKQQILGIVTTLIGIVLLSILSV